MSDATGGGLPAAWYRGAWWLWLLRPLEALFRLLAATRRLLYRTGILRSYRAPVPVVVVGNITVGGTGKTPVVIALVEALQAQGLQPGVVSRGYGGRAPAYPLLVDSATDASFSGDEPLLVARRTGVPVAVAPDRAAAIAALCADGRVDLVISDDGLQHYGMARDFEIALVDAHRGLGNGFCLPAGPLREPPSRLASVQQVLLRGGDDAARSVSYAQQGWVNLASGEQRSPQAFAGQDAYAVAGIGQPQQFFKALASLGVAGDTRAFPDHHRFSADDFTPAAGRPILMTEKDAVKCGALAGDNAWYLRIEAVLPDGLVERLGALVTAKP